ncbi:MAG: AMED_5909 family protein, partial [Pseudonocardiaceae bacterium]
MLAYYQRSAGWYAEVAEIDRGHHHEALYMA